MMNMFSLFDLNIKSLPMNLLMMTIMYLNMNKMNNYWYKNTTMKKNKNKMMKMMLMNKNNKNMMELLMPIMMMTTMMNLMNIIPNILSPTSTIMFNTCTTMMLWMNSTMMMMKNKKIMMMNLSPKNTPMMMMWIINLIEMNSMIFQILSLTMRLSINMMLGHIIMMLMNKTMMMMMYMTIEMMIILIQSYIFITLNMLNFNNTN